MQLGWSRRSGPYRALSALVVLVGPLTLLAAAAAGGADVNGLLHLAPALLLGLVLLARRYPGERTILRLATRGRPQRRRVAPSATGAIRRGARLIARGGSLLGRSLAVRPPPPSPLAAI